MPARARLLVVLRSGQAYAVETAGALRAGGVVILVAPEVEVDRVAECFCREAGARAQRMREFYGEFTLDGAARLKDVLVHYEGTGLDPALRERTIDETIRSRLPVSPVEGDAVDIARLRFTVRTVDGARILRAGIALPRARTRPEQR